MWVVPEPYTVSLDTLAARKKDSATILCVECTIRTEDGNTAGDMTRSFRRDDEGKLVAEHAHLDVDDEHKGRGIAGSLTQSCIGNYREMGVDRIELLAIFDGTTVWADFGFSWPYAKGLKYKACFTRFLTKINVPDELVDTLTDPALSGAFDVYDVKFNDQSIGKDFLKSLRGWRGQLLLHDDDPGFKRAKERLRL